MDGNDKISKLTTKKLLHTLYWAQKVKGNKCNLAILIAIFITRNKINISCVRFLKSILSKITYIALYLYPIYIIFYIWTYSYDHQNYALFIKNKKYKKKKNLNNLIVISKLQIFVLKHHKYIITLTTIQKIN